MGGPSESESGKRSKGDIGGKSCREAWLGNGHPPVYCRKTALIGINFNTECISFFDFVHISFFDFVHISFFDFVHIYFFDFFRLSRKFRVKNVTHAWS